MTSRESSEKRHTRKLRKKSEIVFVNKQPKFFYMSLANGLFAEREERRFVIRICLRVEESDIDFWCEVLRKFVRPTQFLDVRTQIGESLQ